MGNQTEKRGWYAVHTKPRQEAVAEENLIRQDFITYLPHIVEHKRRKGRWVDVIEPLFPRYLFIQIDLDNTNISPIRSTLGVSGLVRLGTELTPIPDDVIRYIKHAENPESGIHDPIHPQFEVGEKVEVLDGPFAGLQGIYQVPKGEDRAMILVELLGRRNEVAVKLDDVSKL